MGIGSLGAWFWRTGNGDPTPFGRLHDDSGSGFENSKNQENRFLATPAEQPELAAGEIANRFTISAPSISRHLLILKHAELITERRDGNRILYRLVPDRLSDTAGDFLSTVCPTQILQRRATARRRKS